MQAMFRKCFSILLLVLCLTPAFAQSRLALIGLSAALPGSGELATGHTSRGISLLAVDAVAISAFFKTGSDMDLQKNAYKNYAIAYANTPEGMNSAYYQAIQEYISSEDFNKFQEMMARNYFVIYQNNTQGFIDYMAANTYGEDESWQWQSNLHWQNYKDMRRTHQKTKINHNLAFGVLLLNRAISIIDMAILTRNVDLAVTPNGKDGIMMNYSYKF